MKNPLDVLFDINDFEPLEAFLVFIVGEHGIIDPEKEKYFGIVDNLVFPVLIDLLFVSLRDSQYQIARLAALLMIPVVLLNQLIKGLVLLAVGLVASLLVFSGVAVASTVIGVICFIPEMLGVLYRNTDESEYYRYAGGPLLFLSSNDNNFSNPFLVMWHVAVGLNQNLDHQTDCTHYYLGLFDILVFPAIFNLTWEHLLMPESNPGFFSGLFLPMLFSPIHLLNLMMRYVFGVVFVPVATVVISVLGLAALAGAIALTAVVVSLCIIPLLLELPVYVGKTCCRGISAVAESLFYNRGDRLATPEELITSVKFRAYNVTIEHNGGMKLD